MDLVLEHGMCHIIFIVNFGKSKLLCEIGEMETVNLDSRKLLILCENYFLCRKIRYCLMIIFIFYVDFLMFVSSEILCIILFTYSTGFKVKISIS